MQVGTWVKLLIDNATENPAVTDDPTLRAGDIVATKAGLMAYSGGANGPTFTPISTDEVTLVGFTGTLTANDFLFG